MATHSATAPVVTPSLEDIHSSVPIPRSWWRRFFAFSGPAFLISVGYMDPGNWGTDLEAGSKYEYRLLWVLLLSNLMALLLQTLATRLGVVAGRDLAQACRESYPHRTVVGQWILAEIAIAACDLAEVIGTIIALKLLFNMPYLAGLGIAAADTLLLLALQRRGVRLLELLTLALIGVIAVSFAVEIFLTRPQWGPVLHGFLPGFDPDHRLESLNVAIAIIGATVMPHNLYLHSALVQTRAFPQTVRGKRLACKYNFFDSMLALNGAFFVNVAIMVMAGARFFGTTEEMTLQNAHKLLGSALGATLASTLFAVALLASGQSSTLTGTLAGQVVMEGFVHLRVRPWVRRMVTRLAAIVPALLVLSFTTGTHGDEEQCNEQLLQLLILSQAVLGFQLPFAIIPLVQMTSDRRRMGEFASRLWLRLLAWGCAVVVIGLDGTATVMQMSEWAQKAENNGWSSWWVYGTVGPAALALVGFLVWVTVYPLRRLPAPERKPLSPPDLAPVAYRRVGVAIEFGSHDPAVLARAAALVREQADAELVVMHIVEGVGAEFHGVATAGRESQADRERMAELVEHLRLQGLRVQGVLGFGTPVEELVRLATEQRLDMLVLGTHGHRFFADLALGATVSPLLHRLKIPVLVVPTGTNG